MGFPKKTEPFVFANHTAYYKIAFDNYVVALYHDTEAKAIPEDRDWKDRMINLTMHGSMRHQHSIISVICSAMAAEAFINYYGLNRLTKNQFEHYDKLGLYVKWCVLPLVIIGKGLKRSGPALQRLDKLIWLRNRLVHYKSASIDLVSEAAYKVLAGIKRDEVQLIPL